MGIHGLLPFLKKASKEVDIHNYSGATAAVDAYCWLHKGAFSCAEKLGKGEPTDGYIYYCMKMVNVLLAASVKPILVFDGQNLPSKSVTDTKRRENREKYRKQAKQFLREGKLKEARDCFQKTVDITPEMAHEVILACRSKNVDCIVAPYEADAQLAYLNKRGVAQIIITEDSDLILFGCEKVIFKMDISGRGVMVEQSAIANCLGAKAENFTFEKFRYTCILSGCDYLPSLPGIGLAKSCKFFNLITNADVYKALGKIPSYLKMPNLVVPAEYKEGFVRANNTFLYQIVFCPLTKKLVPLTPYPPDVDGKDMPYAGKYLPDDVAIQLALGHINIHTMKHFPDTIVKEKRHSPLETKDFKENNISIWDENYQTPKKTSEIRNRPLSPTKEITTIVESGNIFRRIIGPLKREREQKSADAMTDEEIQAGLTNIPVSPSCKKSKSENSETETAASFQKSVFRESKLKKVGIGGTPIIRSRFFVSDLDVKEMPIRTTFWLDTIDAEYGPSGVPSKTKSIDTSSTSPFRTLDKKIIQSNHDTTIEMSKPPTADHQQNHCKAKVFENMQEVSQRRIPRFKWENPLISENFCANNLKLQNSPKCESHFKPVLPQSLPVNSIHEDFITRRERHYSPSTDVCGSEHSFKLPHTSSDSSEGFNNSTISTQFRKQCASITRVNTDELVLPCAAYLDDDDDDDVQEILCNNVHESITTSDDVHLQEKTPQNDKRKIGSRFPGLRRRHTQPSIKDMLNKFAYEKTSKQLQK